MCAKCKKYVDDLQKELLGRDPLDALDFLSRSVTKELRSLRRAALRSTNHIECNDVGRFEADLDNMLEKLRHIGHLSVSMNHVGDLFYEQTRKRQEAVVTSESALKKSELEDFGRMLLHSMGYALGKLERA